MENSSYPPTDQEDRWSQIFRQHGEIWGDGPSPTGEILIARIKAMRDRLYKAGQSKPTINVVEAGYGYGRDAFPLLKIKHTNVIYTGIDPSGVGLALAQAAKSERNADRAWFIPGDFTSKNLPIQREDADFVLSHRVMHLLGPNGKVRDFLKNAFDVLKPGGEAIIAVRDPRDFKPDRMEWNKDGDAVYKDRPDHVITLWSMDDLVAVFKKAGFDPQEAIQGSEPESTLHPGEITYFTVIRAIKPEITSP